MTFVYPGAQVSTCLLMHSAKKFQYAYVQCGGLLFGWAYVRVGFFPGGLLSAYHISPYISVVDLLTNVTIIIHFRLAVAIAAEGVLRRLDSLL